MPLKDLLRKKVPERQQTEDFRVLLQVVDQHKISQPEDLRLFLNTCAGELQTYLNERRSAPTMTPHLRKKAMELDWIKRARKFLRYL